MFPAQPLIFAVPPALSPMDGGYLEPEIKGDWRLKPAFMNLLAQMRAYNAEAARLFKFMDERQNMINIANGHLDAVTEGHNSINVKPTLDPALQIFFRNNKVPLPEGWSSWNKKCDMGDLNTVEKVLDGIYASKSKDGAREARLSLGQSISELDQNAQWLNSITLSFVENNRVKPPEGWDGWHSSYNKEELEEVRKALEAWPPGGLVEDKQRILEQLDKQIEEFPGRLSLSEDECNYLKKLQATPPPGWDGWVKESGYTKGDLELGLRVLHGWNPPHNQENIKDTSIELMNNALKKFPSRTELNSEIRTFLQENNITQPDGVQPWARLYLRDELLLAQGVIEEWPGEEEMEKNTALRKLREQIDAYPDSAEIDEVKVQVFCQECIGWVGLWEKTSYTRSELIALRGLLQDFEDISRKEEDEKTNREILAGQKSTMPEGIEGAKVKLSEGAREFFTKYLAKPDWRDSKNWDNPYTDSDLNAVAGLLNGFIMSQSDFATDAQLKVQAAMQHYNNGVALLSALQVVLGELVKSLLQATR